MRNIFNFGGVMHTISNQNDDTTVRTIRIDGNKIFINEVEVPLELIQDGTTINFVVKENVGSIQCDREIKASIGGNVGSLDGKNDIHVSIGGNVGSMKAGRDVIGRYKK